MNSVTVLTGRAIGRVIVSTNRQSIIPLASDVPSQVNHSSLAPSSLQQPSHHEGSLGRSTDAIPSSRPSEGADSVVVPGLALSRNSSKTGLTSALPSAVSINEPFHDAQSRIRRARSEENSRQPVSGSPPAPLDPIVVVSSRRATLGRPRSFVASRLSPQHRSPSSLLASPSLAQQTPQLGLPYARALGSTVKSLQRASKVIVVPAAKSATPPEHDSTQEAVFPDESKPLCQSTKTVPRQSPLQLSGRGGAPASNIHADLSGETLPPPLTQAVLAHPSLTPGSLLQRCLPERAMLRNPFGFLIVQCSLASLPLMIVQGLALNSAWKVTAGSSVGGALGITLAVLLPALPVATSVLLTRRSWAVFSQSKSCCCSSCYCCCCCRSCRQRPAPPLDVIDGEGSVRPRPKRSSRFGLRDGPLTEPPTTGSPGVSRHALTLQSSVDSSARHTSRTASYQDEPAPRVVPETGRDSPSGSDHPQVMTQVGDAGGELLELERELGYWSPTSRPHMLQFYSSQASGEHSQSASADGNPVTPTSRPGGRSTRRAHRSRGSRTSPGCAVRPRGRRSWWCVACWCL
jgi:hypothetical protein